MKMNLRTKTALVVVPILAMSLFIAFYIFHLVLQKKFNQLEHNRAMAIMDRSQNFLRTELDELKHFTEFLRESINEGRGGVGDPLKFKKMHTHVVAMLDDHGNTLWQAGPLAAAAPKRCWPDQANFSQQFHGKNSDETLAGIEVIEGIPVLIAVAWMKGGVLVTCQLLQESVIDKLSSVSGVPLHFLSTNALPEGLAVIQPAAGDAESQALAKFLWKESRDTLVIGQLARNIQNQSIGAFVGAIPRALLSSGQKLANDLTLGFAGFALVTCFIVGWFVSYMLVLRIENLNRRVLLVVRSLDLRSFVVDPVKDEIGELSEAIAQLLGRIKEAEKEREIAQAGLVTASRLASLGEMAAGIAHEINNPTAVVYGRLMQIADMMRSKNQPIEAILPLIDGTAKAALRISEIVKGLRSFSRSADMDFMEETPMNDIIQETMVFCGERFRSEGVLFELPANFLQVKIKCRKIQISQVLLNLLNNALDAVLEAGQKDSWIKIKLRQPDEKTIEICVIDSGPGIPEDVERRIFEPFFTTKAVGKGTGIGLTISYGIVENHGGRLYIDKSAGNTCFVMAFPVN